MIRRISLFTVTFALALAGVGALSASASNRTELNHSSVAHVYPAKGTAGPGGKPASLLSYHGGPIRTGGTAVHAIFWGNSWNSNPGDKITGVDAFYTGVGGTSYAGTNTEYTNSGGAHVSSAVSYSGHIVDSIAAPSGAPSTSAVLAEVAHATNNNVTTGDYYPVYSDQPRGNAGYCAWHSSGSIGGHQIQFGFFFKLDGDPGCDPGSSLDAKTSVSQGMTALGNVTGHELSEMLTDPQLNAWYDRQGAENADKCAWKFSGKTLTFGGQKWIVQGNFSNAAYNGSTGYVRGCIDGA